MEQRKIGSQGLVAGAIGLGCMGMTHAYGTGDEAESIATIHRALDCGVTLLDTAEVYGPHTNEELVGKAIRGRRDSVVLATKFGIALGTGGDATRRVARQCKTRRRRFAEAARRGRNRSLLSASQGPGGSRSKKPWAR